MGRGRIEWTRRYERCGRYGVWVWVWVWYSSVAPAYETHLQLFLLQQWLSHPFPCFGRGYLPYLALSWDPLPCPGWDAQCATLLRSCGALIAARGFSAARRLTGSIVHMVCVCTSGTRPVGNTESVDPGRVPRPHGPGTGVWRANETLRKATLWCLFLFLALHGWDVCMAMSEVGGMRENSSRMRDGSIPGFVTDAGGSERCRFCGGLLGSADGIAKAR